jgi:two-component system phosphate regulon sensor histidine kinase PhoR
VERNGSDVEFSVADRGPGVPLDDQGRIFERFYQSESALRESSGGYGLGLAIAKLIVEHHGGRIWVDSQIDDGATFHFAIPVS